MLGQVSVVVVVVVSVGAGGVLLDRRFPNSGGSGCARTAAVVDCGRGHSVHKLSQKNINREVWAILKDFTSFRISG